ncbi:hypothetical protein E2C01_013103 [Portunus trituberculatus]|uniref:Uncharacterized protein n=1 Tax=Portunus trituberculatus TaxID=210409 RepID=A0A5B7DFE4_PORTR|nr:hypothetical protein [Portunus trituberculatus]
MTFQPVMRWNPCQAITGHITGNPSLTATASPKQSGQHTSAFDKMDINLKAVKAKNQYQMRKSHWQFRDMFFATNLGQDGTTGPNKAKHHCGLSDSRVRAGQATQGATQGSKAFV